MEVLLNSSLTGIPVCVKGGCDEFYAELLKLFKVLQISQMMFSADKVVVKVYYLTFFLL